MATYGETFKDLRIQRGFQVMEVYGGIISRTTAYRFESGENQISIENLTPLLYNIGIFSVDEFLFLHNQRNQLPPQNLDLYVSKLMQEDSAVVFSKSNGTTMAFYQQYKDSSKKEERFYAYLVHYNILTSWQQELSLPPEFNHEYQFMQNYLLQIESWGLRELENFGFLSGCFDRETRRLLLPRFKSNFLRYQDYFSDWANHYMLNLVNYSMNTSHRQDFQDLPEELVAIQELMENNPRLNWYTVHLIRYLHLQILVAAVQGNKQELVLKLERLIAYQKAVPEVANIAVFYVDHTRKKIKQINAKLAAEIELSDS